MVNFLPMNLKVYLFGLPLDERRAFAKRCDTSIKHLYNVAYGYRPCGESLAICIDRESASAVTCEELRPDVDWAYLRGSGSAGRKRARREAADVGGSGGRSVQVSEP